VDMRGNLGGVCTVSGDRLYDYAKLYQSLVGYDFVLMDKPVHEPYRARLTHTFETYIESTFDAKVLQDIRLLTSSLFFTLIPLHDSVKHAAYYRLCCNLLE